MGDSIYVAYARQSIARSGDHGDSASVADQFRAMEAYAERLGGKIVKRYSDVDVSGSTESREGLDRLLVEIKEIRPAAVLIRDVSRLARDTRIFLTLVDTIQRSGVQLLSTTESLEDRTLSVVISAFAERERLALAGRVAGGVREHARRGKTFGRTPYGYRRINGEMFVVETEAAVVRQVFAWCAAGDSTAQIARRLNDDPAAGPAPGGSLWSRDFVRRMLTRQVYAGDVVIAEARDISGRKWPRIETRDAHPAIIARADFEAAQRRAAHQLHGPVRNEPASPFAGFASCAHCGGRLYIFTHKRHDLPSEREPVIRRIVRCSSYAKHQRNGVRFHRPCSGANGSREAWIVEDVMMRAVDDLLGRALPIEALRVRAAELAVEVKDDRGELARRRLSEVERRRSRLLDAYESGSLDLLTWQGRDRALATEQEALSAVIASVPTAPSVDHLLALRRRITALSDVKLDYRAFLTELGANLIVNLDDLSVRIEVGGDARHLFCAHT